MTYTPGTGLQVTGDDADNDRPGRGLGYDGQDPINPTPPLVYIVFGDPGITPGAGCIAGSAVPSGGGGIVRTGAKCRIPVALSVADLAIRVDAGAGDDLVGLEQLGPSPTLATVDLGPGDDTGIGTDSNDVLRGGDGNDLLQARQGDDTIEGGAGDDTISPGLGVNQVLGQAGDDRLIATDALLGLTTGTDTFAGGSGSDLVSYAERTAPITLSATDPDGQAGESDTILKDVERVVGGQGDDTLELILKRGIGSLAGGPGNDKLRASGPELITLSGDAGTDSVSGGPGPNGAEMRDGLPEKFSCGGDADVLDADLKDLLPADCERVSQGAILEGANVVIRTARARLDRRGRVRVRLACPTALGSMGCAGTLRVSGVGRGAARDYSIRSGRRGIVRLAPARADRRRLRRARHVLRAESVEAGQFGDKTTIRPIRVARRH